MIKWIVYVVTRGLSVVISLLTSGLVPPSESAYITGSKGQKSSPSESIRFTMSL